MHISVRLCHSLKNKTYVYSLYDQLPKLLFNMCMVQQSLCGSTLCILTNQKIFSEAPSDCIRRKIHYLSVNNNFFLMVMVYMCICINQVNLIDQGKHIIYNCRMTLLLTPSVSLHQFPLSVCTMGRSLLRVRCTVWTRAGCVSVVEASRSAPRLSVLSWSVITFTSQRVNAALSAQVLRSQ